MITDPPTLSPDDTVTQAVRLMIEHNVRNLPVVDKQGQLLGTFSTYRLINLLLPTAATMDHGLTDLAFIKDTLDDLKDRFRELNNQRVGNVMRTQNIPVAHHDTPLIEVALLLHKFRTRLPVVSETNKLEGMVTYTGFLKAFLNAIEEK
jgi:CBS domain-containing protein